MELHWKFVGKADEDYRPGEKLYRCENCGFYIYKTDSETLPTHCPHCKIIAYNEER